MVRHTKKSVNVTAAPKLLPASMNLAQLDTFVIQHQIIKSLIIVIRVMVYPCCGLVEMEVAFKSFFIFSAVSGVTRYLKLLTMVIIQ